MDYHDVIVIGASAGGIETLSRLLAQLPDDLPATVFIVQHISVSSPNMLAAILDRAGPLPVKTAEDGVPFGSGEVYVAPSNHHLLIKSGRRMTVAMGPKENRSRPAIDPLFRSAAAAYGPRVIGVVLSGLLDDGAAGLLAIRRCNGITIVQDPADAFNPEMPENALAAVTPDHCLAVAAMGEVLVKLAHQRAKTPVPVPDDVQLEIKIAEHVTSDIPAENTLGELVSIACPECGGPLWEIDKDSIGRYRCHVGHGFTGRALVAEQNDAIERTLWAAMRSLEEKAKLQTTLAHQQHTRGRSAGAAEFEQQAAEAHQHVEQLRRVLAGNKSLASDT